MLNTRHAIIQQPPLPYTYFAESSLVGEVYPRPIAIRQQYWPMSSSLLGHVVVVAAVVVAAMHSDVVAAACTVAAAEAEELVLHDSFVAAHADDGAAFAVAACRVAAVASLAVVAASVGAWAVVAACLGACWPASGEKHGSYCIAARRLELADRRRRRRSSCDCADSAAFHTGLHCHRGRPCAVAAAPGLAGLLPCSAACLAAAAWAGPRQAVAVPKPKRRQSPSFCGATRRLIQRRFGTKEPRSVGSSSLSTRDRSTARETAR